VKPQKRISKPRSSKLVSSKLGRRIKRIIAIAAALTLLMQNFAWAVCADGTNLPPGGYVVGTPPVVNAANWSPNVFTGTTGSLWVPDNSVFEHNDPNQPLTGGGHNWVFDQGSTLCKVTDTGPAGQVATGWTIPPNNSTDCIILPIITAGQVRNLGDIPFQGDVITPTCDPSLLSQPGFPNPDNTYFNQLGCSISGGLPTTPATATSFLFVAGVKGGMFSIPLTNTLGPVLGGESGKVVSGQNYYSQIPEQTLLTNAAISKDGQFAIVTSTKRDLRVWGCLNPLGDPGDPGLPIDPAFFPSPGAAVSCMQVGENSLQTDLTTAFGPDNQPYFGGQRVVTSFNSQPGGNFPGSWPNCIWQNAGAASVADAFAFGFTDGCGGAQPNNGFVAALVTQPPAIISHGNYMYVGPVGGTVLQIAVTQQPNLGISEYNFRTYITGLSTLTGLGVADDLGSLMIFTDPSGIGLASQEVVTRLPLCEDMLGELPPTSASGGSSTTTTTTTATTTSTNGSNSTTTITSTTNITPATNIPGTSTAPTASATPGIVGVGGVVTPTATTGSTTGTPTTSGVGALAGPGGAAGGAAGSASGAARTASRVGGASRAAPGPITPSSLVTTPPPMANNYPVAPPSIAGASTTGPIAANVTFISQRGLPRIAWDRDPVGNSLITNVAANGAAPVNAAAPVNTGSVAINPAVATPNTKLNTRSRATRNTGKIKTTRNNARRLVVGASE
jgi:hypothetical protein